MNSKVRKKRSFDPTISENDLIQCSDSETEEKCSLLSKLKKSQKSPKRTKFDNCFNDTFADLENISTLVNQQTNPVPSTSGNLSGFEEILSVSQCAQSSPLINKNKNSGKDLNYTDLFNDSQLLQNVESALTKIQNKRTPFKKLPKTQRLMKKREFWDDTLNDVLDDLFKSSPYKKELQDSFQQIERTICNAGADNERELTLLNASNMQADSFRNSPLDKTVGSPKTIKSLLEEAEKKLLIRMPSGSFKEDPLPFSSFLGSTLQSAMLDNMEKSLSLESANNTLVEEVDSEFTVCGPFFGLPEKVMELIKAYKGIQQLYDWQQECLNLPAIKNRKNLVYALPTSGGKTLVAEILILRELLCRKKNAIFILPYVAIVQEKVWAMSPFAVTLDFLVEEYAAGKGNYPPRKRRRKRSAYICTIEKALGLINSLIESERIDEIGLIVVDELHLLGDASRGTNLEAALTKIMILREKIQIVGMSATIGNLDEICQFLNADVYKRNFRPVELVEYIKCENEIAKVISGAQCEKDLLIFEKKVNYYKNYENLQKMDPDHLGGLVADVIPDASCLVFCKTKKNCENVALLLCKVLKPDLKKHLENQKKVFKKALQEETGTLCKVLEQTINYGIAYHHSGLTSEERKMIEEGYRQGILCVICCTSTLAAGVNLPAKRVIIRNPYVGRDFINLSRYKQMVGRAGRAGYGEMGESITICTPAELPQMKALLLAPMDLALSSMHLNDGEGLQNYLLSCVCLGFANTKHELNSLALKTLLAVQCERLQVDMKLVIRKTITKLFKLGAVTTKDMSGPNNVTYRMECSMAEKTVEPNQSLKSQKTVVKLTNFTELQISKLGLAAMKGGLDLARAHMLYDDLLQAQSSLVLITGLHLMYLVTPYNISEQVTPNKEFYFQIYNKLDVRELQTAKVLGLTEAVAVKLITHRPISEVSERVLSRFYVTLMLYDLWNEMSVYEVAEKYDVNRGVIQNLMTAASTFASNVYHFCSEFENFWAFSLLIKGMSERLSHCCVKELVPLMKLPSVKQNRAKQLFNAGYRTLQSIAKSNPDDLMRDIEYMTRKLANQLIAASKMILLEKVENLREEAEDVLEGINLTKI